MLPPAAGVVPLTLWILLKGAALLLVIDQVAVGKSSDIKNPGNWCIPAKLTFISIQEFSIWKMRNLSGIYGCVMWCERCQIIEITPRQISISFLTMFSLTKLILLSTPYFEQPAWNLATSKPLSTTSTVARGSAAKGHINLHDHRPPWENRVSTPRPRLL